jgi:hypothetical protein
MKSEAARAFLSEIEAEIASRPNSVEFEMAYQARVAADRIKFAIQHAEQFGPRTDQMREVNLQLLDALQRLEILDRRFQERSRVTGPSGPSRPHSETGPNQDERTNPGKGQANGHSTTRI